MSHVELNYIILCHFFTIWTTPFFCDNHLKQKDYLIFQTGTPVLSHYLDAVA